ncbi:MAG: membrane protein insertion efficiency factor YidD [Clostridia bacterium]|nr:membrane protein insertion efficiency factor YidD [Clostridia bacterium]
MRKSKEFLKEVCIYIISFYQKHISGLFGNKCRFYPSCSEYTKQAIDKYGIIKGIFKGIRRILKCNPFHRGGVDFLE